VSRLPRVVAGIMQGQAGTTLVASYQMKDSQTLELVPEDMCGSEIARADSPPRCPWTAFQCLVAVLCRFYHRHV